MTGITILTIPHSSQRYPTVGDWWFDDQKTLQIRISHLSDPKYEQLIAVHEIIEALLCRDRGITQEAVDAFDMAFKGVGEPGDDPRAPYANEHAFATMVERALAVQLNVDWDKYSAEVDAL